MVGLRGGNSSMGAVSHGCGLHGGQQNALDLTHRLQTSLGMQLNGATPAVGHNSHVNHAGLTNHSNHISHGNHGAASQVNLTTLSNVSLLMSQQTPASLKLEQNTRYSNSNCMLPSHHYRLLTQTRPECYHPTGGAGSSYMPGAGNTQNSSQAMRGPSAPQPSAPPAPQQDISKTSMTGSNYVSPLNQTQSTRPQYPNFSQYRATQHSNRPTTHPRQQQPYMGGSGASTTGPVMYHPTVVFQSTPMGIPQTFQQPRSNSTGYYQYMPYISYSTPTGTPYYYPSNGQQLSASTLGSTVGRASAGSLVQPPAAQAAPGPLPLAQNATHIHPGMPGIRPNPPKRTSRRLPIIDPLTKQDIFSEQYSNDSQYLGGDSSEGQTAQPESTHSFAEEFGRMVTEAANQPSARESCKLNFVNKAIEVSVTTASRQPHTNAISNINIVKSEIYNVNETKNIENEIIEFNETPVVSAISDSPVVVPKISMNVKQYQKNSEQNQTLNVDNKILIANIQDKQKIKPDVPQDETDKQSEIVNSILIAQEYAMMNTQAFVTPIACVPISASIPMSMSSTATSTTSTISSFTPLASSIEMSAPQPQRVREPRERIRSEDKEKLAFKLKDQEIEPPVLNGPTTVEISSIDSLLITINPSTSQVIDNFGTELTNIVKKLPAEPETEIYTADKKPEIISRENTFPAKPVPTATELLSASIEKLAKEQPIDSEALVKAESTAIQAQVKLTQGIASVARNHPDSKMKDLNLSSKTDPDTANGNPTEVTKSETVKDEVNQNEKAIKNTKNINKKLNKMVNHEPQEDNKDEVYENGNVETDETSTEDDTPTTTEDEQPTPTDTPVFKVPALPPPPPPPLAPKYKYSDDQWSPYNKTGKKCYDIGLLKQIKEDPLSKNKPNIPLLDACNVTRTTPIQEPMNFNNISRPIIDSLLPNYAKNSGVGLRSNTPRDPKKDGRNMPQSGKGSMKLVSPPSGSSSHRQYISISLSREEVKLNQSKDAWRPTRFKKGSLTEDEFKTQDLYKKFRGILNKLTPQKFDTLLDKVKGLEINTQARLEGVIDLVFEKAIEEPNFSEAYAAMCSKLSMLKVPSDNAPEQCVNFRALIISKCQNQFTTEKVDENVLKIEKELAECTDPAKKKELQDQLSEEHRRVRMRSVGNVRFIGELYKLKMLTAKIMVYCMTYLIEKLEEEKLECLCKLLTTIGEQVESEVKEQLENVFKKMQDIVDRKSNKISNRVRFMIQDVIDLRRGRWVTKNVVDSQPKMMDQIQKEAELHQRNIELMNANPMGGFRREDGRGKRGGDGRRQGSNSFMDNQWKAPRTSYTVDTSKLKAVTQKNLSNIKLAPPNSAWNQGSGAKNPVQTNSNSMISLSNNKYSMLETVQDPTSLSTNKDMPTSYHHSKSIERSTFNSRGDYNNDTSSGPGSIGIPRSNSGSRSTTAPPKQAPEATPAAPLPQEPLPEQKQKMVKTLIMEVLVTPNDEEFVSDFKQTFPVQYHSAAVTEILNIALEKSAKDVQVIAKVMHRLISNGTISCEYFLSGINEILECAPDLYIDIPMLYEYLGKFIAPQIENKHITFVQTFRLCENIISSNHGHMFLKPVIRDLKDSMGPFFVKTKWLESGLDLKQWMTEEQVPKWLEDNKFEFLEDDKAIEETKKIITPTETQSKLLQLMNADENCDCIRGWIQDNLGVSSKESWFIRALIQAICENALFGPESHDVPHFSQERMNKFAPLISEFGESREIREESCLFGIQQLIYRLQHPPGLALEIFQFLHEQYIISVEGFTAWEVSEMEPEGKGVMLKALTSFFTNIKEADNEESCSED